MPRKKPRSPKVRIVGDYDISTGHARFIKDPHRDGGYLLELNKVPSSYVVLQAPRILDFEYMKWIADILRHRDLATAHFVHLGGAACSLPRFFADVFPSSRHSVVDIDPEVLTLTRTLIDVPSSLTFHVSDARTFIHALHPGSADVIVRDVFAGPNTPRHVTTVEFFSACKKALSPQGLYVANIGDKEGLRHTRAEIAGLLDHFAYVGAIAGSDMLAGREYGNIVVMASDDPLPDALRFIEPRGATPIRDKGASG